MKIVSKNNTNNNKFYTLEEGIKGYQVMYMFTSSEYNYERFCMIVKFKKKNDYKYKFKRICISRTMWASKMPGSFTEAMADFRLAEKDKSHKLCQLMLKVLNERFEYLVAIDDKEEIDFIELERE